MVGLLQWRFDDFHYVKFGVVMEKDVFALSMGFFRQSDILDIPNINSCRSSYSSQVSTTVWDLCSQSHQTYIELFFFYRFNSRLSCTHPLISLLPKDIAALLLVICRKPVVVLVSYLVTGEMTLSNLWYT